MYHFFRDFIAHPQRLQAKFQADKQNYVLHCPELLRKGGLEIEWINDPDIR